MVGLEKELRPVLGLFKCSCLNLGSRLTGNCGVRTGGLGVSMRFMKLEEGGVFAVSRTFGLGLVSIFAAEAFLSDTASPYKGGGKEVDDGGGKGEYRGT
jgi:hypothetical protein